MEDQKKQIFPAILVEVIIVGILIVLVLGIFNYFGLIGLSKTFSFLSFLPQRQTIAQQESIQNNSKPVSSTIRGVVFPPDPTEIKNDDSGYSFLTLDKSFVEPAGKIRINAQMLISGGKEGGSGIIFSNSSPLNNAKNKYVGIFYSGNDGNWYLEYKSGGKSEYTPLTLGKTPFLGIILEIDSDGKILTVLTPGESGKKINLSSSLYEYGKNMNITAQAAPGATLTIYSILYEL